MTRTWEFPKEPFLTFVSLIDSSRKNDSFGVGHCDERVENQNMSNKMTINIYLLTSTLNANGLNTPIKRHMVTE